jgi:hypothetical protein
MFQGKKKTYTLPEIHGMTGEHYRKLWHGGLTHKIRNSNDLLMAAANFNDRNELAERINIDKDQLLRYVNVCDLLRIKDIFPKTIALLKSVGITTMVQLRNENPLQLYKKIIVSNLRFHLTSKNPSFDTVDRWVEEARDMRLIVTYGNRL